MRGQSGYRLRLNDWERPLQQIPNVQIFDGRKRIVLTDVLCLRLPFRSRSRARRKTKLCKSVIELALAERLRVAEIGDKNSDFNERANFTMALARTSTGSISTRSPTSGYDPICKQPFVNSQK